MPKLFLSHATADDAIVRALQQALERQGTEEKPVHVWIDSRELVGGDALLPTVAQRIRDADAFLVLVSPAGLQSAWVGRELTLALQVQEERGRSAYRVIPLALDGTRLGALEAIFGEPPLYIPLSSAPNGITEAMPELLAALGLELRAATSLLGLPWELLHDGTGFLFQGARPWPRLRACTTPNPPRSCCCSSG